MVIDNGIVPFAFAKLARNNWKSYGWENINYHVPCEHQKMKNCTAPIFSKFKTRRLQENSSQLCLSQGGLSCISLEIVPWPIWPILITYQIFSDFLIVLA